LGNEGTGGNPQSLRSAIAQRFDIAAEHHLGVDQDGCFLKGARTICGEEDAMRAAFKQNDAKILFKRYDDAGKMRLAYPQTLGRPMKIQGGGQGQRRFQTI
jgi:hypothetical protein